MACVLLGLYDQPVRPSDQTSFDINKIGGCPDWMVNETKMPLCSLCGVQSVFLGQFYCPLSGSTYHRTLYVFTCSQPSCSRQPESWTVLRSQRLSTDPLSGQTSCCSSSVADEWGSEANDWGNVDGNSDFATSSNVWNDGNEQLSSSSAEVECKFQEISITGNDVLPNSDNSLKPSVELSENASRLEAGQHTELQSCYLYVIDESQCADDDLQHEKQLLKQYAKQEGVDVSSIHSAESGGERYAASEIRCGERAGDRVFYKFTKRINRCPQQLIRYSYGGEPLYAHLSSRPSSIARCSCGWPRVFEMQLMPGLVNYLLSLSGLGPVVEFLSVCIFTCERSCWADGDTVHREYAVVDYEHDLSLVDQALSSMASIDYTKLAADAMQELTE